MSFNLIDTVKGYFTNELIGKASSFLGESESGVTKAISGILPSFLGGLLSKSSSAEGAQAISQIAKEQHESGILDNFGGLFGGNAGDLVSKGGNMLNGLLGDKFSGISSLISNFSGIKSSSASSLMSMAAPAVMGFLGKHAAENNLNAGGLASMLSSQKDNINAALPSGLNLGGLFDNAKVSNMAGHINTAVSHNTEEKTEGSMKILLPLLLLALAAAGAWYFFKDGCNKGTTEETVVTDSTHANAKSEAAANTVTLGKVDTLSGDFIYDAGEIVTLTLPNNGGELKVGKNSTEYKLVEFLNNKSATIDTVKGNWFEFTNVHFKTGGAELTDQSMDQLKNMVAIAKAYPSAQFKFGGYTDSTGDAGKNLALSQRRADAVAAMVKKLGAAEASFVGAKGYGKEWPIGDNKTVEGRAMNRRVAVNVKAK